MAPAPSPTLVHLLNPPSGRHLHHLRRQVLGFSHQPPAQSSASRPERFKPRTLNSTLKPSVVLESPSPPSFAPTQSNSIVLASTSPAIPAKANQSRGPNRPGDVPGNIVAAAIVIVLILGGLIGLVVGGEMLRRQTKNAGKMVSPSSRCVGRRKSKPMEDATRSPQQQRQDTKTGRAKFPYGDKTLTPLARPPPVLNKERQRRLSDVWPIRTLARALCNRRPRPEQAARGRQHPTPGANPQTTWSEFSTVTLYVPSSRTVLTRIPEEREEDCQSQASGVKQSLECDSEVSIPQAEQPEDRPLQDSNESVSSGDPEDCGSIRTTGTKDEDAKSLGSTAPEMTLDGGESSRSSMGSLESFEDGHDRASLKEEVFELRRAQTRSMQMNKGVLLSLSSKTLPGHERSPSRSPSTTSMADGSKEYDVERELSLAVLGGSFSAVNLDEFPSPPSILPVIPSFVSGF